MKCAHCKRLDMSNDGYLEHSFAACPLLSNDFTQVRRVLAWVSVKRDEPCEHFDPVGEDVIGARRHRYQAAMKLKDAQPAGANG